MKKIHPNTLSKTSHTLGARLSLSPLSSRKKLWHGRQGAGVYLDNASTTPISKEVRKAMGNCGFGFPFSRE